MPQNAGGIPPALSKFVTIRFFLAIPCILFFAGIGAFFLFVPPLLIAMVWLATLALLLVTGSTFLYCFGVRTERKQ
jgi:hypothetical protein